MNHVPIIKLGGSLLDHPDQYAEVLDQLVRLQHPFILVHGGGNKATELSESLGIKPTLIDGRRVTDAPTLDVAVMTYAGLVNTRIVADLNAKGIQAMGLTGADLHCIRSAKRPATAQVDFGYVGDIQSVNTPYIEEIRTKGWSPVFCAITMDDSGQLLNTNADAIASNLALAYANKGQSSSLIYVFDHHGVYTDSQSRASILSELTYEQFLKHQSTNAIHHGMVAKLEEGFKAASKGVHVRLGRYDELEALFNAQKGTQLLA